MVSVTATYTGANAIAVEQSVATPIEQKVNGVEDMIYMKSTNASERIDAACRCPLRSARIWTWPTC